ncbi:MAG: hypothetical protein LBV22_01435 [Mycoplasmataceae bacterium]|nr:hypothetical protein [Mycoplasmataceae bacterium]
MTLLTPVHIGNPSYSEPRLSQEEEPRYSLSYARTCHRYDRFSDGSYKIVPYNNSPFRTNFNVDTKKIILSSAPNNIDTNKIFSRIVQSNIKNDYIFNYGLLKSNLYMAWEAFKSIQNDGCSLVEYLGSMLEMKMVDTFVPFSKLNVNLAVRKKLILRMGEPFNLIKADILSSKTINVPYLFTDTAELQYHMLYDTFFNLASAVSIEDIVDTPIVVMIQYKDDMSGTSSAIRGNGVFLGLNDYTDNNIETYSYSIANLVSVNKIADNIINLKIDRDKISNDQFGIFSWLMDKLSCDVYYETANANFGNENIGIKKNCRFSELVDGININVNPDHNNNDVFILKNIITNEYVDDEFYIQSASLY